MSLKTATLIALICLLVTTGVYIPTWFGFAPKFFVALLGSRFFTIFTTVAYRGSLILFFAVFYLKQKVKRIA